MMKLPKTLSSSSLKCEDLKIHKDLKKEKKLPTSFNSSEQMMRRNFSDVATEEKKSSEKRQSRKKRHDGSKKKKCATCDRSIYLLNSLLNASFHSFNHFHNCKTLMKRRRWKKRLQNFRNWQCCQLCHFFFKKSGNFFDTDNLVNLLIM